MDGLECDYEDCRVLARALRNRTASSAGVDSPQVLRTEIKALIDLVEAIGTRESRFLTALDAARSLLVLGRQEEALDNIDFLLCGLAKTAPTLRPWRH